MAYNRKFSEKETLPTTLEDCYLDGFCTFMVTGKTYPRQDYYRLPETPDNEGICAVCIRADFMDRKDEWQKVTGRGFFCDYGAEGKSSRLWTPPPADLDSTQAVWDFPVDSSKKFEPPRWGFSSHKTDHLVSYQQRKEGVEIVESDLPKENKGTQFFHGKYIEYFKLCWDTHAGLVIRPEMFWFIVANQLAQHIKDNPEPYRNIFTVSQDKTVLEFVVSNPDQLNISMILERLQKVIPGIDDFNADMIINAFNPTFTTSTPKSQVAIAASFCEAMEAYYSYCTSKCGISKVRVLGTPADWLKMANHCIQLRAIMSVGQLPQLDTYLETLSRRFSEIANMNQATWKDFFRMVQCGSGHDDVITGWVGDLYALTTPQETTRSNEGTVMARMMKEYSDGTQVTYVNLQNQKRFRKCYGVMSSQLDSDHYMNPEFNYVLVCDGVQKEAADELQEGLENQRKKRVLSHKVDF